MQHLIDVDNDPKHRHTVSIRVQKQVLFDALRTTDSSFERVFRIIESRLLKPKITNSYATLFEQNFEIMKLFQDRYGDVDKRLLVEGLEMDS